MACDRRAGAHGLCDRCIEFFEGPPPWPYEGAVADAIQRGKYNRQAAVRIGLSRLFARMAVLPAEMPITFVPAHWRRRLWRGFDFPAEIAAHLAQVHQRPLVSLLRAQRRDPRLATLLSAQQRRQVVAGRFVATTTTPTSVILVDDVQTSGATLAEASAVLQQAGCEVVPLTLAYVP
jgi:predicted amidophosphoribosyltransferase